VFLCAARCKTRVGSSRKLESAWKIFKVSAKFEYFYGSIVRSLKNDSILAVRLLEVSVFLVASQVLTYLVYTFFTICVRLSDGEYAVGTGLGYGLDK
jgi:hypothetical protein